jgi:hypothetical protein
MTATGLSSTINMVAAPHWAKEIWIMADNRLEVLKKARTHMVETRFAMIEKLSGGSEEHEKLLHVQSVIDVIDAAIEDEETEDSAFDDMDDE